MEKQIKTVLNFFDYWINYGDKEVVWEGRGRQSGQVGLDGGDRLGPGAQRLLQNAIKQMSAQLYAPMGERQTLINDKKIGAFGADIHHHRGGRIAANQRARQGKGLGLQLFELQTGFLKNCRIK